MEVVTWKAQAHAGVRPRSRVVPSLCPFPSKRKAGSSLSLSTLLLLTPRALPRQACLPLARPPLPSPSLPCPSAFPPLPPIPPPRPSPCASHPTQQSVLILRPARQHLVSLSLRAALAQLGHLVLQLRQPGAVGVPARVGRQPRVVGERSGRVTPEWEVGGERGEGNEACIQHTAVAAARDTHHYSSTPSRSP